MDRTGCEDWGCCAPRRSRSSRGCTRCHLVFERVSSTWPCRSAQLSRLAGLLPLLLTTQRRPCAVRVGRFWRKGHKAVATLHNNCPGQSHPPARRPHHSTLQDSFPSTAQPKDGSQRKKYHGFFFCLRSWPLLLWVCGPVGCPPACRHSVCAGKCSGLGLCLGKKRHSLALTDQAEGPSNTLRRHTR